MASRLLHYLIASELAERQEIKDKNRFCIGALLPDLSGHEDGSYNTAHFWVELEKENKKGLTGFYLETGMRNRWKKTAYTLVITVI